MAARLNPRQDERCRAAIQTTQLCKRLNLFALGLPDPISIDKRPVEMSDAQIRAALGLLRKTLPDLAVTQIAGPDGGALLIDFRWADAPVAPTINGTAENPAPENPEQPTLTLEYDEPPDEDDDVSS